MSDIPLTKTSLSEILEEPESGSRPKGGVNFEGEIPSFGGENVTNEGGLVVYPVKKVSTDFFDQMRRGKLNALDVIINKDGANTGKSTIYRNSPYRDACINEHLFILRGKSGYVDQIYLHYLFLSSDLKKIIDSKITGSAQPGLNSTFVKNFPIQLPPLSEQKKIASILTSVDEVIENTQKQIDKLQDLKKATMNELLTKGIGHTEFKDSELGRIPKSWEVKRFGTSNICILDGDRGKAYPKQNDFSEKGFCLFLSAKNVTKVGFKFQETFFISREKHEEMRKGTLETNDIVVTTRGTVGNFGHFTDKIPFKIVRINSGMAILRNQEEYLSTEFLFLTLGSDLIKNQIDYLTFGSAQPQLTIGTLGDLKFPLPSIDEQKNITDSINALKSKISLEDQKLAQTQALKKSLMQDLLTGKKRVQVN